MPLPVTFATLAQGNQPLSLLDTQFNTLSQFTIIPCAAVGQNTVVLTPIASSPSITAYTSLTPVFSWFQPQTTTGAVTISIAGLGPLTGFGSNGGVPLGAGDLSAGKIYQGFYDGGVAFIVNAQNSVTAQGAWVPTLFGASVAGTPVYTQQAGSYEQIGRQVTARFFVAISANTGMTGGFRLGGLPFPNGNTDQGLGFITSYSGWTPQAGYTLLGGTVDTNVSNMRFVETGFAVTISNVLMPEIGATAVFNGMVTYHV